MKRFLLPFAVVVLALGAPSASADDSTPWAPPQGAVPFDADANLAYRLVIDYWGMGEPPLCESIVKVMTPALADDEEGNHVSGRATRPEPGVPTPCFLTIQSGLDFPTMCMVMAHEVGHLLGFGHSEDPASPMHSGGTTTMIPACWDVYQRRDYIEELHWVRKWCRQLKANAARPDRKAACWRSLQHIRLRIRSVGD